MQLHLVEDDASPCSRTMYQQCSSQPLSHGLLYVLPQIHATWSRMGNRIYRASLVPRHTVKLPFSVLVVLRSRGCVVASCWLVRSIVAVLEEVDRHATDMRNGVCPSRLRMYEIFVRNTLSYLYAPDNRICSDDSSTGRCGVALGGLAKRCGDASPPPPVVLALDTTRGSHRAVHRRRLFGVSARDRIVLTAGHVRYGDLGPILYPSYAWFTQLGVESRIVLYVAGVGVLQGYGSGAAAPAHEVLKLLRLTRIYPTKRGRCLS